MNKLFKPVLLTLAASVIFIGGFSLIGMSQTRVTNNRLLREGSIKPDIWFNSRITSATVAYGYYVTKPNGSQVLVVINPEGGVTEIQL